MFTVREKFKRGAGVPSHLLPRAAHPSFWDNPWKRAFATPVSGTFNGGGQDRDLYKHQERQNKMGKSTHSNYF